MATETKKPMTREEYELERKRIRELMNKTEEENKKYLASQPPLTEEQMIKLLEERYGPNLSKRIGKDEINK
ncbi:MAG: hypothetical protein MJY95_01770 [Bacteroidaceae bacterium]|nr:hypothetical protein [Bacteroidaceae bacterium]